MFRVGLTAWSQRVRPLKAPVLVVAISALLALLFTIATRPSAEAPPRAAGEANIELIKDEHSLVAEFVRGLQDTVKAERLAAVRERSEMKVLAVADSKRSAPAAASQSGRAPMRADAVPMPRRLPIIEPPLQLAAAASQSQAPARPSVIEQARAALASVQQIPQWVRAGVENVTDWAINAPSKAISQLPERRFL